jgi:PST family polysaccharide transporter
VSLELLPVPPSDPLQDRSGGRSPVLAFSGLDSVMSKQTTVGHSSVPASSSAAECAAAGERAGLRARVLSGLTWSGLSQFGRQAMQFATTLILARLITPDQFGLVGMATVVTGFAAVFRDMGTTAAVIRGRDLPDNLLSSIFWLNALVGTGLMSILSLLAPQVAAMYHQPAVAPILRALSLTFFIGGISIVHQAMLERSMSFRVLGKVELAASLIGSLVGIVAAVRGCAAWSLVYQSIAVAGTTTLLLWYLGPRCPKDSFSTEALASVSGYSANLTGSMIINYLARNADNFLIGRYLGTTALGYYGLAYRLLLLPMQLISCRKFIPIP